ncbi:hypothetical protein [Photobacterium profundum]|uniref:Uncharacterized protein n=1 Tax=Photobacterium profundum (strain SS9) TaxID=298386 RepID=Q6LGL4_PHOPR|nr:hypothetical protein [Photobacterium profundum]CAG23566.1 hypothetical protein PBPRB1706 [Photobacterium profundum SS9]
MVSCKINLSLVQKDIDGNLKLMNLPTTKTVAGSAALVWAMIDRIDKTMAISGGAVKPLKMSAVARTGTVGAGLYASFWAGAVIGSTVRAIYKNTDCTHSQVMAFAKRSGVTGRWLQTTYAMYPELLNG